MAKYRARSVSFFDRKKVGIYGKELAKLEQEKGAIRPEELVEIARNPKSVFHDVFEWSNAKAAHHHRLWQARQFVAWVHVEIEVVDPGGPKTISLRAFHSVAGGGERRYVSLDNVLNDPELYREHLEELTDRARRWADDARRFAELGEAVKAIDELPKRKRKVG